MILTSIPLSELIEKLAERLAPILSGNNATVASVPGEELISCKEVAALLKVSTRTIQSKTKAGELKGYRSGRRVLYKKKEVVSTLKPISL